MTIRTWHKPLLVNAALMFLLALVAAGGVLLDHRTLLGAPVWLKPLKFGVAFGAYALTLAWVISRLTRGRRVGWWVGTVFAVCGVLDVGVIAYAAARGTFSHFNVGTDPVARLVQAVFTYAVPPILVAILVLAVLVLMQRTGDRALTAALRAGLGLAVLGIIAAVALGGRSGAVPRTVPDAQNQPTTLLGAHGGAGSPDGRGMPLTDWSTTGGDLRVPHFAGLHGIHALLLLTWGLALLVRSERVRARLVRVGAAGYAGIFTVLFWQAWRNQPLTAPDAKTLTGLAVVAGATALGAVLVVLTARAEEQVGEVAQVAEAHVAVEAAQGGDGGPGCPAGVNAGL
ncbi:hypothetical protein [Dactylosporangium sp. CA-139066]|uniref:hypothetical protein n=1 Tax=Dactylosporangium sp. CA-139066 TaxID=3239930 RepID=UPI003D8A9312